jgi:hypothetical protein
MSSFTTPLNGEISDDGEHIILTEKFEYHIGSFPSEEVICIPIGFESDFASIPRYGQCLLPKLGKYSKAAVLHDYLYSIAYKNKKFADDVFLEAMKVLLVPKWKRYIMYYAVRFFGNGNYIGDCDN